MIMGDFIKKFFDIKFWKFILVGVINTLVGNGLQFVLFALFACGQGREDSLRCLLRLPQGA